MNSADKQYLEVMQELLDEGNAITGRNGGTASLFGKQLIFRNVAEEFPILTTKRVHFHSIVTELLWFIKGLTNVQYLHDHGVSIWDEWADEKGELGPVYGKQWRSWPKGHGKNIDQLKNVIKQINENPYSRRHLVSAWNVAEVDEMALPPCHCLFQFHVTDNDELDLQLYQRSADWFLGVPFNIASYALLLILVARETGLTPRNFIHTFGNYHLYDNHRAAAKTQLERAGYKLPKVKITATPKVSIFDLTPYDISLENYQSMVGIKAEVSK